MSLTCTEIAKKYGVTRTSVTRWIRDGLLKASKITEGHKEYWTVEEEDLQKFIRSEHFGGHPEDILSDRPFTRVPPMEDCYPYNLLCALSGLDMNLNRTDDVTFPFNPRLVDIPAFRKMITELSDKEQRIIEFRYQFGTTLEEAGKALGCTRERVRQIQARAEKILKHRIFKERCFVVPRREHEELRHKYELLQKELTELRKIISTVSAAKPEDAVKTAAQKKTEQYATRIEELNLPFRAYNCLKRARIDTVGQILAFDALQSQDENSPYYYKQWLTIRNLGRKSLMEVAKKVFDYCGYRIRYYDEKTKSFIGLIPISEAEEMVPMTVDIYRGEENVNG